jgi:superfamily I DNA/RNA helicase
MDITQENLELQKLKSLFKKTIKIFGPPGTGKTYTLIERVLKTKLRKGIQPEKIAFISFTNKAVNTAVDRALSAFPHYSVENFTRFKTLHKYCRRYFKEEIFDIKNCMIDFALQESILKRSDRRLEDDEFIYKDWSLGIYDKARNMMEDPIKVFKKESYKKDNIDVFQRKISTYEHYKQNSFIDFTDMIERAIDEIDFPELDVLILDEAQDFTPLQWSVLYKMAENSKRIYLAGDDDQGIYQWNGADSKYFTTYFPGRKVVLRKTRRFGKAIHHFTEIIRRGILNSEEKEYLPDETKQGSVKRYLNFREIDFNQQGTWYILGRVNRVVNELRMAAKEAGLYFGDNKGNKSFDRKQWQAIKAWTAISNGKTINKSDAEMMYRYIRDIEKDAFRTETFWIGEPDFKTYNFETLKEWCGLIVPDEKKNKEWWWILRRNFTSRQKIYFIRLLKRYGQKQLNDDPTIIIDTIHSVKGGEADHVVLASKNDYASDFYRKNKEDQSGERKVYYTGASRAKNSLHILSTDYKYHYPIGKDYLIYLEETR